MLYFHDQILYIMAKINWREGRIHVLCWTIFIFLEVILAGIISGKFSHPAYYLLYYALNICLFYHHSLVVMESFSGQRVARWTRFSLTLLFGLGIYFLLAIAISLSLPTLTGNQKYVPVFNSRYYATILWRGSFFVAYATGYFFLRRYINQREVQSKREIELREVKNVLLQTEQNYLKAQINPHLLFNTLNLIKNLKQKNNDTAEEAILNLSSILHYAMQSGKQDYAFLADEVTQIERIINLNNLRYDNQTNIRFIKTIEDESIEIIPLVLLTLVENVFKHGNLIDMHHLSIIEIDSNLQQLSFKTCNPIGAQYQGNLESTGIANIRKRLEKAYPNRHNFSYGENDGLFYTELNLKLF